MLIKPDGVVRTPGQIVPFAVSASLAMIPV